MIFNAGVSASEEVWKNVDIELQTIRRIDHDVQELDLLRQKSNEQGKTIAELERSLASEKRTNELNERELYLNKKIIEVKDMEIQALNRNFDQMKEVADRSLKLAETAKPKSNWEVLGLAAIILFIGGMVVGGL